MPLSGYSSPENTDGVDNVVKRGAGGTEREIWFESGWGGADGGEEGLSLWAKGFRVSKREPVGVENGSGAERERVKRGRRAPAPPATSAVFGTEMVSCTLQLRMHSLS